ncbi:MAG: hypothetical protein WC533_03765 [Candidatus Pacearchaeota archaeon]
MEEPYFYCVHCENNPCSCGAEEYIDSSIETARLRKMLKEGTFPEDYPKCHFCYQRRD